MSTRKRKQEDEELVALPSDVSEDEEEYVTALFHSIFSGHASYDFELSLHSHRKNLGKLCEAHRIHATAMRRGMRYKIPSCSQNM